MAEQDWIIVGKIVAAQGLKGEVRVQPSTDFPERFEVPGQRWLQLQNQEPQSVELERGRIIPGKNIFVVKFEHLQDRTQAENVKGAMVLVRAGDRPTLEDGEYHVADLMGLEAFNAETQEKIGVVTEIFAAGQDVLQITDDQKKQHLVPFVESIVPTVNLVENRLEINVLPGLLTE
ncbi:MAG: ribosome maturation factor RimM [Limnothrix sp.]